MLRFYTLKRKLFVWYAKLFFMHGEESRSQERHNRRATNELVRKFNAYREKQEDSHQHRFVQELLQK